jgi:hypothetical protein
MHDTGSRVILSLKDFTSPEVIRAAELLFIKEDSVDRHETPP